MRVVLALALFTSLTLFTSLPHAQQKPVFKTSIDLRQLDVTVLDKNRQPVKGLTAADFIVTEDKVIQKIESFSFVDLGDSKFVDVAPVWSSKVASDVVSNDLDSARVFMIVVDDVYGMGDLWAKNQLPKSVATFVEQMGPEDIASVVFTGRGDLSVNFTKDKAKLISSVNWFLDINETVGACNAIPTTVLYATHSLALLKNKRKALVFFGGALDFTTNPLAPCNKGMLWQEVVQVARENNVTMYPVDTMGLRPGGGGQAIDPYLSMAHETGGHAAINLNSFTDSLNQVFEETGSYYLLAYQPTVTEEDGRYRQVSVKVNRPDVEVVKTRGYWAPKAPTAKKPGVPQLSPESSALAGVLPLAQIPIRAAGAAFRGDAPGRAVVALSMAFTQPAFVERTRESVDLLIRKFNPDGLDYGSDRQLIALSVQAAPANADMSRYEVLARVDVPKPGRYDLRLSAHSDATDRRGSIYVDVDVPDFYKDKLSLSGVVMNVVPGLPAGPPRALNGITPVTPSTERSFERQDLVTAFLRVYEGMGEKPVAVALKTRILDATGKQVFEKTESLATDRFKTDHSTEVQLRMPLTTLTAGQYLLSFDAGIGKVLARRDVRFEVVK